MNFKKGHHFRNFYSWRFKHWVKFCNFPLLLNRFMRLFEWFHYLLEKGWFGWPNQFKLHESSQLLINQIIWFLLRLYRIPNSLIDIMYIARLYVSYFPRDRAISWPIIISNCIVRITVSNYIVSTCILTRDYACCIPYKYYLRENRRVKTTASESSEIGGSGYEEFEVATTTIAPAGSLKRLGFTMFWLHDSFSRAHTMSMPIFYAAQSSLLFYLTHSLSLSCVGRFAGGSWRIC